MGDTSVMDQIGWQLSKSVVDTSENLDIILAQGVDSRKTKTTGDSVTS